MGRRKPRGASWSPPETDSKKEFTSLRQGGERKVAPPEGKKKLKKNGEGKPVKGSKGFLKKT